MDKILQSRFKHLENLGEEFSDISVITEYWTQLCDGAFAPSWKAIDLTKIAPKTLPRVCVVDVLLDPLDFVYRFWGTMITQMHKYDATGQSISTVPPADYGTVLVKQYKMVYETKNPQTFYCEFENEHHLVSQYVVRRFPLSNDGVHVTGIMSIEEYGKDEEYLSRLFETVAQSDSFA